MPQKFGKRFCARIGSSAGALKREGRRTWHRITEISRRTHTFGRAASLRISRILDACTSAAMPRLTLAPVFEVLENRRLFSTLTLTNGVLSLGGNSVGNDTEWVKIIAGSLTANSDGQQIVVSPSAVTSINMTGGPGNEYFVVDSQVTAPVSITAGNGNDTIQASGTNDTIVLGNGNNSVFADGSITVGNGNNQIVGGAGNDTIVAGSGYDTIVGGGGSNLIEAGANSTFPDKATENDTFGSSTAANTGFFAGSSGPSGALQNVYDPNITAAGGVELGTKFQSNVAGTVTGVRFWKGSLETGVQTGELWNSNGTLLATATFTNESSSGWQQVTFSSPVSIAANTTYIVSYHSASAYLGYTPGALNGSISNGSLTAPSSGTSGGNSVYYYGSSSAYPSLYNGQAGWYWVDVDFSAGTASTTSSASVSAASVIPSPPPSVPSAPTAENTTVTGSNNGNSQAPTPVINVFGTSGQTGHSVFVDGKSSTVGSGSLLNANFSWNFGDPTGQFNVLPGWNAGHIYDNPGTYTVTLTITNNLGLTSTLSTQIVVTASTRTTIYVDTNGSDSNSGLSPTQAFQSEAGVNAYLAAHPDNVTVLFMRGETFDIPNYITVNGSNLDFGAYGTGAAPILYKVDGLGDGVFDLGSSSDQVVIENFTFDSEYVPVDGVANDILATSVYANGEGVTVRNNTFLNVETCVDCYQSPTGVLIENNTAPLTTGMRAYFDWVDGSETVILGNTVANSTRQHIVRSNYTTATDVLMVANNFDRFQITTDPGSDVKTTVDLREGSYFYLADNTFSDNEVRFGPDYSMPTTATVNWIKLDGNTINNAQIYAHGSVEHLMISNNVTNVAGQWPQIDILPTDTMGRQMSDVTIENNTGTLDGALGIFLWIEPSAVPNVITVENNLFAAPSLEPGINFAASVYIDSGDATAVSLFSHNVWAAPMQVSPAIPVGAVNYIAPTGDLNESLYLNATQWNALPNVQDDHFEQVTVSGTSNLQVPVDGQMAGAILPARLP